MRLPPRQATEHSASGPTAAQIAATPTASRAALGPSSAAKSTSSSKSVLAEAEGSSHLNWWQLLCVCLGGVLALILGIWLWWRRRKRGKEDKQRAKELEDEEQKKMKEAVERKKGNGRFGSDESSESGSESYDSVSDGGTIRPSRRKRNRRGWDRRGRGRRRVSDSETESESESSDVSSITYYPRTRGRRRDAERRRRREEDRRREEADRRREARRREEESRYRRDRRHRRSLTPSTSPSPSPERTPAPLPKSRPRKRDAFRDSVFSSYGSMKKAAVRLKYVEAKTKLKKQLEEEEGLEKARQDKIREANREIFKDRLKTEEDSAASSHPLLIPPMKRPVTQSSSGASARSNPTLPTPPTRARQHPVRHISREVQRQQPPSDSQRRPSRQASGDLQRQQLLHNDTSQPQPRPVNRQGSSGPHLLGQNSNELGDEIHQLFGGPKPAQSQSKPAPGPKVENEFVADWLSHPAPAVDVAQPVRTDSVYVPVGLSKDRPTIPKGGLAPAPPPKVKSSPMVASPAQMSTGANKWADRLRAKR